MSTLAVDEPLLESATLGLRLAPALCGKDPRLGERCDWYHGPWQFFRLAGLVISPAQHCEFYLRAFAAVPTLHDGLRVLVSAAADYSMLAHALAGLAGRPGSAEVTVVDACETPLALSQWYAERAGHPIRAVRSDILDLAEDGGFDVICAHAFLGRFSADDRPKLAAKWHALLRPGGSVITVNRIQPAATADWTAFGPEQARAFRARVLDQAAGLRPALDYDAVALAECTDRYTSRQGAYPVRAREEFRLLFEDAGFAIDSLSFGAIARESRRALGGPAVPGSGEYGRIVATRR